MSAKLNELYKNIKSAPSYSAKITEFLRHHDVHSKFKRIEKKNFPRRRVIARFPFEIFMGDLIEYQSYFRVNKGYRYILLLIDCFTKMVYVAPIKRKNKNDTAQAFEKIFSNFDEFPVNLVTDNGKEFFNSAVQSVFTSYGINHYKIKSKMKASIAERAIQTIKNRLQKYFYNMKRRTWIDILDQVVKNYNNTPHRTTGLPPVEVTNDNRRAVYKKMYPYKDLTVICRLKIGDKVRIIRDKNLFEKGYTRKWSEEIYVIHSVRQSNAVCYYKIKNLSGDIQSGIWYYYQLNLVARNADQLDGTN